MRFLSSSVKMVAFFLLLLLAANVVVMGDIRLDDSNPNGWYSTYSKYPEYCSTPAQMSQRTIPPLSQDSRLGETRLVHVTASIRHGARTPTEGGLNCWDGYWDEDSATSKWNCQLKAEMAPPTPYREKQDEGQDPVDPEDYSAEAILFEKHYDALMDPTNNLSNELFGTCETGQLLLQGYEQHITNGQLLRDAYVYDSDKYDHDVKMRLIDRYSQPWANQQIYLRADDYSRVLLSGQVLLRSMLEPEMEVAAVMETGGAVRIPVHLADGNRDIVAVNEKLCPRLTEMRENFERTSIFKSFNNSKEAKEIRKFMKNQLKAGNQEIDILECLLPTICTDKPIPDAFDYENENSDNNMFDRMIQFAYKRFNMHLLANEAEYSKLAMAPLWSEIMDKINPIIRGDMDSTPTTRLLIISGHDDTVAPLMATLGVWADTMWPAYASMFLIEIHEIIDGQTNRKYFTSKYAFRLIYDGKVITHQVKGCLADAELCDVKVFTSIVENFATRKRNCQRKKKVSSGGGFFLWPGSGGGPSGGSIFSSLLLVLVGVLLGGMIMSYYITGSFLGRSKTARYHRGGSATYSDGGMSMPTGSYSDDPDPGPTTSSYHDTDEAAAADNDNRPAAAASFLLD